MSKMSNEKNIKGVNGFFFLVSLIILTVGGSFALYNMLGDITAVVSVICAVLFALLLSTGFSIISPNESVTYEFFGTYLGVIKENGFKLFIPFCSKHSVSLKLMNYKTERLKVNEKGGNPIEIDAIISYKVKDTYKALYDVHNYNEYIKEQSETALREIAKAYPYDGGDNETTLRDDKDEISENLKNNLQNILEKAGVELVSVNISHLAYAVEVASDMLQRQKAKATVDARQTIVDGAFAMVKDITKRIKDDPEMAKMSESEESKLQRQLLISLSSQDRVVKTIDLD